MGTSISWIAVEGVSVEDVARELRMSPAEPDATGRTYQAALLPNGWALFMGRLEANGIVAERQLLEGLCKRWRVVGCDEESHVMYAASAEWRAGREVWAVIHSSEQAAGHLLARGEPPAGWVEMKDELLAKQADAAKAGEDVDYVYEIPLDVAKLVVGYRVDSDDVDGLVFSTYASSTSPKEAKRWWRLW